MSTAANAPPPVDNFKKSGSVGLTRQVYTHTQALSSLGPAALRGAAALDHDVVHLLAVEDEREKVDLALGLGLVWSVVVVMEGGGDC